jgi:hypothetical protein
MFLRAPILVLLLGTVPVSALAQATTATPKPAPAPRPGAAGGEDDPDIITVTAGVRPRGSALGDIKPEVQLGPADIRSFGVSSISELLSQLTPQTTSGRGGSPVILLNGKRISGFNEVRDIPPEAIARVDILPEEVALKYGYTSDQKVVNIVLRQRFRAYTAEMNYGQATDGGAQQYQPEATYLRIQKNSRFNVALEYQINSALFENQRNIVSAVPPVPFAIGGNVVTGAPCLATVTTCGVLASAGTHTPTLADFTTSPNVTSLQPYRTLTPDSKDFTANVVYNNSILGGASATVNGRLELQNSTSDNGLPTFTASIPSGNAFNPFGSQPVTLYRYDTEFGALTQNNRSVSGHLGTTINGDVNRDWHWSITGNYDLVDSHPKTATGYSAASIANLLANSPLLNPYAPIPPSVLSLGPANLTHSVSNTGVIDLLINGTLAKMRAGDLSTSFKVSAQDAIFDSDAQRFGFSVPSTHLTQSIFGGQVNVDVPIASRKRAVLAALGDLSVNGNASAQRLSDFGTLTSNGFGATWVPLTPLSLIVAFTNDHAAPSVNQLSNPQVITPNALVFDPLTGQTVSVTQISGGNPNLRETDRHVLKLEANLKPFSKTDLTINGTFTRTNTNNPISAPTLTQSFLAETFDPQSGVGTINTSPVNFLRSETEQFRWGINFSKPLKSKRAPNSPVRGAAGGGNGAGRPDGARPDSQRPDAQGGARGGGAPGGGAFGQNSGRLQIAVYHTVFLHDLVLTKPGLPALNLLNGDETGTNGGQPQHKVELQSGYFKDGLGIRLSATWQSPTTVNGFTPSGALHFGEQFSSSLRVFANLGTWPKPAGRTSFWRGTRLLLVVNNLFNTRQNVTDGTGAVPISYQPAYLDPAGRTVRIALRKVFF